MRYDVTHMKHLKQAAQKYKRWIIGLVAVIILILIIILVGNNGSDVGTETYMVTRTTVTETVAVTGKVNAAANVDLAFSSGGKVASVAVTEGQTVRKGQVLARLDTAALSADLARARAALAIKELEGTNQGVSVENRGTSLEAIEEQQDTLVENAYRRLLTSDLEAYPESNSYNEIPPTVSGTYTGTEEGEYRVEVYASSTESGASFRVSGLESKGLGPVTTSYPARLGDQGLYIQFSPEGSYNSTEWIVPIPNPRGASYVANLNAYNDAVRNRRVALEEAGSSFQETDIASPIRQAEIEQARADIARIQADINDRIIYAPFDGVVTSRDIEPGETVASGATGISLISTGTFEVVAQVPEIDIAKIAVGDTATIALDAFANEPLEALVIHIDPAATRVDGVPVYEVTLQFSEEDERLRDGMTAGVVIVTETLADQIAIPGRFIDEKRDESIVVRQVGEDETEEITITTGFVGDASMTVVESGLEEGDVIIHKN